MYLRNISSLISPTFILVGPCLDIFVRIPYLHETLYSWIRWQEVIMKYTRNWSWNKRAASVHSSVQFVHTKSLIIVTGNLKCAVSANCNILRNKRHSSLHWNKNQKTTINFKWLLPAPRPRSTDFIEASFSKPERWRAGPFSQKCGGIPHLTQLFICLHSP